MGLVIDIKDWRGSNNKQKVYLSWMYEVPCPFFVTGKNDKTQYIENMKIGNLLLGSRWGALFFRGPMLSIADEDVFLALLRLVSEKEEYRINAKMSGIKTYAYLGPIDEVISLTGQEQKRPVVRSVLRSIARISNVNLEAAIYHARSKGDFVMEEDEWEIIPLFPSTYWRPTGERFKRELYVVFSPYLLELYRVGKIDRIDLDLRMRLRSQTAKAMMRFLSLHREERWSGTIDFLVDALNLDGRRPFAALLADIKKAIDELKQIGFLDSETSLTDGVAPRVVLAKYKC